MRITNLMMSQQFLYNLNQIQENLSTNQEQMSTGKVLNKPSDDPLAVSEDMATRTAISQANSYESTIQSGLTWMKSTDSAMQSMSSTLQSIRDLTLQAMNTPSQTPTAKAGVQQSIAQLINNLYQLVNTKQGNSFLFGGGAIDKEVSQYIAPTQLNTNVIGASTTTPVIANGGTLSVIGSQGTAEVSIASGATLQNVEDAINAVSDQTGVTASLSSVPSGSQLVLQPQQQGTVFGMSNSNVTLTSGGAMAVSSAQTNPAPAGASDNREYAVSASVAERVNVTGSNIFNQVPSSGGTADLHSTLQSILNDINDPSALGNDLSNLDANSAQLIETDTDLGSRIEQMTNLQNQTNSFVSNMQKQQASLEDANMAQVVTQYQNQMATYQAALQMGSKMLLPTLAEYIQ